MKKHFKRRGKKNRVSNNKLQASKLLSHGHVSVLLRQFTALCGVVTAYVLWALGSLSKQTVILRGDEINRSNTQ
jgi:hypothetical protein